MGVGIRWKFLGTMGLAAGAPLVIGLLSIHTLGSRHYLNEKGILYRTIAEQNAERLQQALEESINGLERWVTYSDIHTSISAERLAAYKLPTEAIANIENLWSKADEDRWPVDPILANPASQRLRAFQAAFPDYSELFLTDPEGRLIAATNKTSDYWQGDETWWKRAFDLPARSVWIEGIQFDESARVYSLDVSMPVRPRGSAEPPSGVIKGVINVSPLLSAFAAPSGKDLPGCLVIVRGGGVLAGDPTPGFQPLSRRIDTETARAVSSGNQGWMTGPVEGLRENLVGYAPIILSAPPADPITVYGVSPLYVVVFKELAVIMAPIHEQLWRLTLAGSALALCFIALGIAIVERRIIGPLRLLNSAAQQIASRSKSGLSHEERTGAQTKPVHETLESIKQKMAEVPSGDELQQVADGFSRMAERVLSYHEQLETEIAARTRHVERDLRMAREFQEALLPKEYPQIPSNGAESPVRLRFHHVYKPTLTLGGDFFDVVKLSDHSAGVFLADVVGHGAQSALITAMLRTVFQGLAPLCVTPADLLRRMNQQFLKAMPHEEILIFASACYLIVDTNKCSVSVTSAGHVSPLLLCRKSGEVESLIPDSSVDAALGIAASSRYRTHTRPFAPGDLLFLYTDGVTEARNPQDEEFGEVRLREILRANIGLNAKELDSAVLEDLHLFMDTVVSQDDICFLSVEASRSNQPFEAPGSG